MLFVAIATGLILGRVEFLSLSLGSSGVIFTALALGHLGYTVPDGAGTLGLVLFIYSVGLTAGPRFFRVFRQQGKALALLAGILVAVGAATVWLSACLLDIPADLAAGIFAGAMTSTPGLAAAMESVSTTQQVAVGYGIAYPFGVIGVVLFVRLLPRVLQLDLDAMDRHLQSTQEGEREIQRVLVEVLNPAVSGMKLANLDMIAEANCQVTRVLREGRLLPILKDQTVEMGQHLMVVGRAFRLPPIIALLGQRSQQTNYVLDTDRERITVVATSPSIVGKSLGELHLLANHGVTVSRICRHDVEFVPDLDDTVAWGDALQVVGESEYLTRFAQYAGHRAKAFDQTDLISVALTLVVGIILGSISIGLGGKQMTLGLVGGPMLAALLLGHFGRIGRICSSLPRASRLLMMELGLVLFLADAGVRAGGSLVEVIQTHGIRLCLAAILGMLVPMAVGLLVSRFALKMNYLRIFGGICGGMTSTPGLAAITAQTDSEVPVVSYAAAYPVALILMTLFTRTLVTLLSS